MKEKIKKVLFIFILGVIISFSFFSVKRYYVFNKSYEFRYVYHTEKDFDKLIKELESKKQEVNNIKPGLFDEKRTEYLKNDYTYMVDALKDIQKKLNRGKIKTKEYYEILYTLTSIDMNNTYRMKVVLFKNELLAEEISSIYSNYYLMEILSFNVVNGNELFIPYSMDKAIYKTFESYLNILNMIIEEGDK